MVFATHRVVIVLICIGFLAVQPNEVSCLTSVGIALRDTKQEHGILPPQNQRMLKAVDMEEMNTMKKKNSTALNDKFDPNQSSKRKVRRGADPIHNRS
ncbi:hypothetical protein FNV43_RR26193 [Rhamnella rubrinervis]|uniref:CLAVATA3/ESR (CLE)-related protein 45 n=1 Tax=Rhamnella rubrinervis TaxID=2594499 RepID=A0A8K0DI56_9ROSA|nr:hypothetical protein FNV43_RR26193 [Rhamnella rubrinervis]